MKEFVRTPTDFFSLERQGSVFLYVKRSTRGIVAGVCARIAEHFAWSISIVRVGYLALTLVSGIALGIVLYLLLWAIIPTLEWVWIRRGGYDDR